MLEQVFWRHRSFFSPSHPLRAGPAAEATVSTYNTHPLTRVWELPRGGAESSGPGRAPWRGESWRAVGWGIMIVSFKFLVSLWQWILHAYMAMVLQYPGLLNQCWFLLLCVDPPWKLEICTHCRIIFNLVPIFWFPNSFVQCWCLSLKELLRGGNVALGSWKRERRSCSHTSYWGLLSCVPLVGISWDLKEMVGSQLHEEYWESILKGMQYPQTR